MLGVFIVPTGIGAEIGGHAGDASPAAKLIASCCDKLIVHPNVVNASDINEMTANMLYVEGSMLDRFLEGEIELEERRHNKILVVVNPPLTNITINAVSASRVTVGTTAGIVELKTPLRLIGGISKSGEAIADVQGHQELAAQIRDYDFDVLAIHTPIEVPREVSLNYFRNGGVNPWGKVEAQASKLISRLLRKPAVHAPLETTKPEDAELYFVKDEIVDPRIAPEVLSIAYLHCVLKGLNQAPIVDNLVMGRGLHSCDVDFLVSPDRCWGLPHEACKECGIPIIMVKENQVAFGVDTVGKASVYVHNYWEAAGWIMTLKAGINPWAARRPVSLPPGC